MKPLLPPTGNEAMISLTLNISGFREVGTRALNETGVNSLIVLLLADNGGTEQVKAKYTLSAGDIQFPSGTINTAVVSFPTTSGIYSRIALIANAEAELVSMLSAYFHNVSWEQVGNTACIAMGEK